MRHTPLFTSLMIAFTSASVVFGSFNSHAHAQTIPPAPPAEPPIDTRDIRINQLSEELAALRAELTAVRQQIAQAELDRQAAVRELDELRQFIADHKEYARDFEEYRAFKALRERELRQRDAEAARDRRELERSTREMRRTELLNARAQRDIDAEYRRNGFTPIGLNVYTSRVGFFYDTRDVTPTRLKYDPAIGRYLRADHPQTNIDYTRMTISGSVINAASDIRDLGVAITFFDENGTQVGQHTVQVNNARPAVPYPFTATVEMTLDRPFASTAMYVLYADPVYSDDGRTAPSPDNPVVIPVPGGATDTPHDDDDAPHRVPVYPQSPERP